MSTQHFEYNGFPVSEGTVAAFPCGTVTAAPNRFARSRFGLAMAADIGRVGPWTGGVRMTGEGAAAEQSDPARRAIRSVLRQIFGFDEFHPGQEEPIDAIVRARRAPPTRMRSSRATSVIVAASAFGMGPDKPDVPPQLARQIIDYFVSRGTVMISGSRFPMLQPNPVSRALSGRTSRCRSDSWDSRAPAGAGIGAVLVRTVLTAILGSLRPAASGPPGHCQGGEPPGVPGLLHQARSRRWRPSSRRRSTSRWTFGAWTKRRTSGMDGGFRTRLWIMGETD
ncbi:MAG: hypothetical protein IKS62_04275 [Aeriscardovia sp.]|nr:hypothetical protein [Aeriscardovia sp.]